MKAKATTPEEPRARVPNPAATKSEAIIGATINAACAIERQEEIGSLRMGKQADVIVCDVADYREIAYYAGRNPVRTVIKKGIVQKR